MNISELSIRRPVLSTVLTLIILLFGFIGYNSLGVREYPSVDNPIISVSCSYPGANADVIENQITEPLEQNINGIPGIRSLSSVSSQGSSRITEEFELSETTTKSLININLRFCNGSNDNEYDDRLLDDFKNFSESIDKVIELAPTNITIHTFSVKKASDALRHNSGIYSISGGDASKSVSYSQLKTKFAGYKPYYMYRQKNTVGNLENVGFSLEGHEGLYNVYMMEEIQTIFAIGAAAVTKLVDRSGDKVRIKRFFRPKYPYEYLREFVGEGAPKRKADSSLKDDILAFFNR